MRREELVDLNAFATVAEQQSFTRAAAKLGTSQSALSHAVNRLEARLSVRLLTRTTRRVNLTEAGVRLLATLGPAFDSISAELASLAELSASPTGTLRLTASEHAVDTVLWPALAPLLARYPGINLELAIDSAFTDIVAERFDAGVRLGEAVARDMVAVRIGPDLRMAVVGAPSYFAGRTVPQCPGDLSDHVCIGQRMSSSGGVYAWELASGGQDAKVRVDGRLVFNQPSSIVRASVAGFGLAFVMEDRIAAAVERGELVRVLEDWCPTFAGYHLYFPNRRQPSAVFSLLVDALRYSG